MQTPGSEYGGEPDYEAGLVCSSGYEVLVAAADGQHIY